MTTPGRECKNVLACNSAQPLRLCASVAPLYTLVMQQTTIRQGESQPPGAEPQESGAVGARSGRAQQRPVERDYSQAVPQHEVESTSRRASTPQSASPKGSSGPSYTSSILLDRNSQRKSGRASGENARMPGPGRKAKSAPTKHAWRLHYLFMEMLYEKNEDGRPRFRSQADLAEYLQLGKQYVNQVVNIQTSGMGGVSADIIEHLMHRVGLLPDWFFGEWAEDEDNPSYKDYLASTKRVARKVASMERQLAVTNEQLAEVLKRLSDLEADTPGHRHTRKGKPA